MFLNLDRSAACPSPSRQRLHEQALEHLRAALDILDETGAPAEIGAKVDHAIHDLYLVAARLAAAGRLDQIERNAAPQ